MGAPPEVIHDDNDAIAVCKSPDFCKTPVGSATPPIPYMVFGKGGDDKKYPKSVKSNGLTLKTTDSKFTKTYGDEPGIAKGVKSGTVGDVVEPVTKSSVVRIEGQWVIRHGDKCTLNKGNCPGEYIHVKSVEAPTPPDGSNEEPTFFEWVQEKSEAYRKHRTAGSQPRQIGQKALDYVGEKGGELWDATTDAYDRYSDDPTLIGQDIKEVWDTTPTVVRELAEAGKELTKDGYEYAGKLKEGAGNVAGYVINNPIQSAKNVWEWRVDLEKKAYKWAADTAVKGATHFKDGVTEAYNEDGIVGVKGYLDGTAETIVAAVGMAVYDPTKKAKAVGQAAKVASEGLEAAGNAAQQAAKAKAAQEAAELAAKEAAEAAAKKKAAQGGSKKKPNSSGKNGVRSTGKLSRRLKTVGRTPGKKSKTGREVRERMREEGKLRTNRKGKDEFFDERTQKWHPVDTKDTHMGHHPVDAVDYWNSTGKHHGPKSPEVRKWMLDSDNYRFEYGPANNAAGGATRSRYDMTGIGD